MGEIMANCSQIMSFMSELALLSVKRHRTSGAVSSLAFPEPVAHLSNLSFSAFTPFKSSARRSLPQAALSLEHLRYALSDKALPVQRVAAEVCECTTLRVESDNWFSSFWPRYTRRMEPQTVTDIEQILTTCIKSLERAEEPTRQRLTLLFAHRLIGTGRWSWWKTPRKERSMTQTLMMIRTGRGRQHQRKLPSRS